MSNQFSASYVKRLLFAATASVAVLGFLPLVSAGDQGTPPTNQPEQNQLNTNQSTESLRLPNGFIEKDESAASGVKTTLVQLTQRAVTKDSYDSFFSGFLSDLASRDKARAQEFKGVDQQHLNDLIGQIQTAWQTKYGQAFAVSDKNLMFNDQFPIVQGEVSDPTAAAASVWPVAATVAQAVDAGANSQQQQQCNAKELTMGQAVAVIQFPAGDGLLPIHVSLVHQTLTGWYVDLPVERTGVQIYTDLSSHLTYIAAHQDQWPSDVNEGYRMVARNVASALYGTTSPAGTASAQ
jgi:hypothetical protein